MALSLSAAQKNLRALFINDDGYIIPSFQRPYSWTQKEVAQLYDDITSAFLSDEDYFVGNIVIANSNRNLSHPHVIDGQQRMITLWLFAKVLSSLSNNVKLKRMLTTESDSGESIPKISSQVFESTDNDFINEIAQKDFSKMRPSKRRLRIKESLMMTNARYIHGCLSEFFSNISDENRIDFVGYFLNRIFLLPIELDGSTIEEATSRALVIFETINNRGLDLSDADILKAKLYEMANAVKEETEFKESWKDLGRKCREAHCEINDIFRYYLRLIRAKGDQSTSEPNLRNFFLSAQDSPFKKKNWAGIMKDLNSLGDALVFINSFRYSSARAALLFRILEAHPSTLPISALVVFVYTYLDVNEEILRKKFLVFMEALVKTCYKLPSTADIKYKVFEINSAIIYNREWEINEVEIPDNFFEERRRMRNGLVMLYHYLKESDLDSSQQLRTEFEVERIVSRKDVSSLQDWPKETLDEDLENMANFSIIDFPKSYRPIVERSNNYNSSALSSVQGILKGGNRYSYSSFKDRESIMKQTLIKYLFS